MKCPCCNNEYQSDSLIINYCPICGTNISGKSYIHRVEMSLYDIVERYSPCEVEVLENSLTGECSVGWRRIAESEED